MFLRTIPPWCTGRLSIPIHRFIIRRRDTTRRAWRFPLAWELPWEQCGGAVGAGAAVGAAITTSPSTATRTSTEAIALTEVIVHRNCPLGAEQVVQAV